jgi:hypothetical protein
LTTLNLNFSENRIRSEGAKRLSEGISTTLNLNFCEKGIISKGAEKLSEGVS